VDRLALTTGSDPVPEGKVARAYRFVRDKFAEADLTSIPSETVRPPRMLECPVHMEAELCAAHELAEHDARWGVAAAAGRKADPHQAEATSTTQVTPKRSFSIP
jgi:flavin reductase (DIM6/NTAB) family NADH-FMN oxidoreductase RutF